MEWLGYIASLIIDAGVVIGAMAKLLDVKLNEIHKRDRMSLRYHIVAFASALRKGEAKTRDEFLSIFEQIDEYNRICEKLKIENHLFLEEVKYINRCYEALDILKLGKERIDK